MFRKLLIATAMLTAAGAALAHDGYATGRVVYTDPSFAFSYSSGPHTGFSVTYATGGMPYWGPVVYAPAPVVVVPPPRYRIYAAPPGHAYRHGHGHGWKDDRHYGRGGPGPDRHRRW